MVLCFVGCLRTFVPFLKIDKDSGGSVLEYTTPNHRTSFNKATAFFVTTPLLAFYLVVPQPSCAETRTLCRIYIPLKTFETGISGGCQKSQRNLGQVPFKKSLHGCRWDFPDGLLPLRVLFSTHFYLLVLVAQRMERFWKLTSHAHNRRAGICIGLFSNTALLLSIDIKLLVTFQYHLIPCDS